MKTIAVLLTCHNRKDKTLVCLQSFYACSLPKNNNFVVYLVDDGSTDGTSDAVSKQFPEVNIIQGDGNLYWNRGMFEAWKEAEQKDYDFYLWLNDDTILFPHSLVELIECAVETDNKKIICGSTTTTSEKMEISYGGKLFNNKYVIPNGVLQHCDFFNGNIVLISKYVYGIVGKNDNIFQHALGDFDYGLRARKLGIESVIAATYLGVCDEHNDFSAWCNPKTPILKRFRLLYTPLGNHPFESFIFEHRHNGFLVACFHFFTNYLRVLFPKFWNYKKF